MAELEYLRAGIASGRPIGVDEEAKVIRGYIVAEAGDFKTGRGSFDGESLKAIARIINETPDGQINNYGHHTDVGSADALDAFLGRAKNAYVDGNKVRADMHLDPVSFMSHNGGISRGERLMQRAKSDPGSFATSLVLASEKRPSAKRGQPPIWHPVAIQSSDVVSIGDAVHNGILSADEKAADDELRAHWEELKKKAGV